MLTISNPTVCTAVYTLNTLSVRVVYRWLHIVRFSHEHLSDAAAYTLDRLMLDTPFASLATTILSVFRILRATPPRGRAIRILMMLPKSRVRNLNLLKV